MKKIILIIGIAFLSSSCSKKLYNVEKVEVIPLIDGDQTEWPANTIRSNNNINYAIQQDEDNLYLMVSSFDEQVMKKIMLLGMTYWINTDGKHSKDQGISFPEGIINSDAIKQKFASLKSNGGGFRGRGGMGSMPNIDKNILPDQSKLLENFKGQSENIGLINFSSYDDGQIINFNRNTLDFKSLGIVFDTKLIPGQSFTFEIAIPKRLLKKSTKVKKDTWGIGIATNDPNLELNLPDSSRLDKMPARFKNKLGVSGKLEKINELKALLKPIQFWVDVSALKK
ncbi:hypothetical protein [Winogradskyella sp. PG-2]|uniref:hypothetical protein n=1 Tax=Winogradskyella sp. PG-2 TaxID=754409 RepID=UPI0005EE44F1|nr:hypothetical protein [Winogradskyella sp. PG-2]